MLFLSTTDIPTCQLPFVLQIIYFGKLILNVVEVLLPICLIIFIMIDFTKCLIMNNDGEQSKVTKLAVKRIMYTVLVYAVPYIVSLVMGVIADLVPDYSLCITNATPENIAIFTERYEVMKAQEEEKKKQQSSSGSSSNDIVNNNVNNFASDFENLLQYDPRWKNAKLCNGTSTMGGAGCGYTAYTMVVRSFGHYNTVPTDIVSLGKSLCGSRDGAASRTLLTCNNLNNHFTISSNVIADEQWSVSDYDHGKQYLSKVEADLKDGKKFIILIPGHYISLLGINSDGTVVVGDSAGDFNSTNKYTLESLYDATKNFRIYKRKNGMDCKHKAECGWTLIISYSKK